jgi:phosphate transport system permease protein
MQYPARKALNKFMMLLISSMGIFVLVPLFVIFIYLMKNGLESLSFDFFFKLPRPVGEVGGGVAHALLGSFYMVVLSAIIAIPWGVICGVYLSEYQSRSRFTVKVIRFATELLNGTPSIVLGIFVYMILVVPLKKFSALAGGISLAIVILPTIIKTTEEILRLIPDHIRHAGLSLGLPRWKVTWMIIVNGAKRSLLTGILIGLARASGETAPLLFTAFGNMYFSFHLMEPMASLPVQIYNYAISPYPDWHKLAWTGSFVLILLVMVLNIGAKIVVNWKSIMEKMGRI